MGRFPQDRFTGRRSSGGRFGGGDRSERPTMHDAVCDQCGKDCRVPFRPTGDKPVYCSDCFEKQGNVSSGRRNDNRGDRRDSFGSRDRDREMFSAVCDKCGKDCEVPFRPSGDKPIYCSRCFEEVGPKREDRNERGRGSSSSSNGADNSQLKEQLNSINNKLDKLLTLLTPAEKPVKVKEEKKAVAEKKVPAKKKAVKKTKKVLKKEVLDPL